MHQTPSAAATVLTISTSKWNIHGILRCYWAPWSADKRFLKFLNSRCYTIARATFQLWCQVGALHSKYLKNQAPSPTFAEFLLFLDPLFFIKTLNSPPFFAIFRRPHVPLKLWGSGEVLVLTRKHKYGKYIALFSPHILLQIFFEDLLKRMKVSASVFF